MILSTFLGFVNILVGIIYIICAQINNGKLSSNKHMNSTNMLMALLIMVLTLTFFAYKFFKHGFQISKANKVVEMIFSVNNTPT